MSGTSGRPSGGRSVDEADFGFAGDGHQVATHVHDHETLVTVGQMRILFAFDGESGGLQTDGVNEFVEVLDDMLAEAVELRSVLPTGCLASALKPLCALILPSL